MMHAPPASAMPVAADPMTSFAFASQNTFLRAPALAAAQTPPATIGERYVPAPWWMRDPVIASIGHVRSQVAANRAAFGASFQATPAIYVMGALNLAHIRLANTQTGIFARDFLPLVLGGFYSMAKMDIGLVFSDDLKQGTDYLRFDAVLRYHLK